MKSDMLEVKLESIHGGVVHEVIEEIADSGDTDMAACHSRVAIWAAGERSSVR